MKEVCIEGKDVLDLIQSALVRLVVHVSIVADADQKNRVDFNIIFLVLIFL